MKAQGGSGSIGGENLCEGRGVPLRYFALGPMRGLAALWVFLLHYRCSGAFQLWQPDFAERHPLLDHFCANGNRGVSIFFVISGYCMALAASQSLERRQSVREFVYRRAKRIYPTFWFSILLICFLQSFTYATEVHLASTVYAQPPSMVCYSWLDWIKIASLTRIFEKRFGPFLPARYGQINGAYWTLGIEFQFYLVVAAALLCRRWFYPILAAVTLAAVPVYFVPSLRTWTINSGIFLYWWLWFACGLGVYWILQQGITPRRLFALHAVPWSVAAIAAILVGFACLIAKNQGLEVPVWESLIWPGGLAVLLWLGAAVDHPLRKIFEQKRWVLAGLGKGLTMLGAMSYSLYLIHCQVFTSILVAVRHVFPNGFPGIHVSVVLGTLLTSYVFYRLFELPFLATNSFRTVVASVPQRVLATGLSVARVDQSQHTYHQIGGFRSPSSISRASSEGSL